MQRTIVNPLYRDTVRFIKTSAETGGQYSLFELTLLPGGANPPHIHTSFAETFTAVEGILGIRLKKRAFFLKPGESYTVQKNEVHNFFNGTNQEIRFTVRFEPGFEGMENLLCIMYGMATDGLTTKKGIPKNLAVAAMLMEMGNSYPTGLFSLLRPVLARLAKRAIKKGLDRMLIDKYCGVIRQARVNAGMEVVVD